MEVLVGHDLRPSVVAAASVDRGADFAADFLVMALEDLKALFIISVVFVDGNPNGCGIFLVKIFGTRHHRNGHGGGEKTREFGETGEGRAAAGGEPRDINPRQIDGVIFVGGEDADGVLFWGFALQSQQFSCHFPPLIVSPLP